MKKKPREAKLFVTTFEVIGRGRFPLDMLRYDTCVPDREQDAAAIEQETDRIPRTVRLRQYGTRVDGPTLARWASFGWSVDPASLLEPGFGGTIG